MLPRYRNVCDSNFALVSPSDFDGRVLLAGNEMKPSLVFVLLFVADALEQNVRLVGF